MQELDIGSKSKKSRMHTVDKEKIRKKVGAAALTTTTVIDNTLVLKKRFSKATPLESEFPTFRLRGSKS
jgi:hypothetical protein